MLRKALLLLTATPLIFASCIQQPDMAALKKTVDEFNTAALDAMKGGDREKVLSFYEDNAVSMPPNMAMVKGKDGIKAFMEQMMQSGMKVTACKFSSMELDASGKIAYEVGNYEMSMTHPAMGDMNDNGKYLTVWRQQPDGSWKVHAETWNTAMPMPSMDEMMGKKEETKKGGKK